MGCSRWSPTRALISNGAFPPCPARTARGAATSSTGVGWCTVVRPPPERVAEAAETYSLATDGSAFVRLLFRLRGLTPPSGTLRAAARAMGFAVLAEEPRREIVLGVAGRFWALDERANLISLPDAQAFVAFSRPGHAKATMSLRYAPLADGRTRLSTETRVTCVDAAAYRRFTLYWALI